MRRRVLRGVVVMFFAPCSLSCGYLMESVIGKAAAAWSLPPKSIVPMLRRPNHSTSNRKDCTEGFTSTTRICLPFWPDGIHMIRWAVFFFDFTFCHFCFKRLIPICTSALPVVRGLFCGCGLYRFHNDWFCNKHPKTTKREFEMP